MLLMWEISWHCTGGTKMKKNIYSIDPPEAQILIKNRHVNKTQQFDK